MSKFFNKAYENLEPYVPGEQSNAQNLVKLNTNESPYPAFPMDADITLSVQALNRYPDPNAALLIKALAKQYSVEPENIVVGNGSDEILDFLFAAYCSKETGVLTPEISYGFYPVFASVHGVPYKTVELQEDFSIDIETFFNAKSTVCIANPNAPFGLALTRAQVEEIVKHNKTNVVIIDEAYVDFGAQSCVPLICEYENLCVCQTFSKSRNLAGARIGLALACADIIQDIQRLRNSKNPYNVNSLSLLLGAYALENQSYYDECCQKIMDARTYTTTKLQELGFYVLPSLANFLFCAHENIAGAELYEKLREQNILIRHFDVPKISNYNRITVGTKEQMDTLLQAIQKILKGQNNGKAN